MGFFQFVSGWLVGLLLLLLFLIADCVVYIETDALYLLLPAASGNTAVSDVPFSLHLELFAF